MICIVNNKQISYLYICIHGHSHSSKLFSLYNI